MQIVLAIEKETGIGLQGILKRDVSVLSRLASISEMNAERKILKMARKRLNA